MGILKSIYQKSHPQRIDKYLESLVSDLSRGEIQDRIKQGHLRIDNQVEKKVSRKVQKGDEVVFETDSFFDAPPEIELEVLYEDKDTLVVDKPAGVVMYPTKRKKTASVSASILDKYPEVKKIGEKERPGIVHRLDKQTSGVVIIAKTEKGFEYYKDLFRSREIQKEYTALVYGKTEKHEVIEKPLTKIGYKGQSRVRVEREGRDAKTEYWLKKVYGQGLDQYSLIRVELHTGRTHQIRVHMDHIGHPVMGDTLYGKPNSQKLKDVLPRQFLHASQLEFKKMDGTWLTVKSSLPKDLRKVIRYLDAS